MEVKGPQLIIAVFTNSQGCSSAFCWFVYVLVAISYCSNECIIGMVTFGYHERSGKGKALNVWKPDR